MLLPPPSSADAFLLTARAAMASGDRARVEGLFAKPSDGRYLFEMVDKRRDYHGGLDRFVFDLLPSPPGWRETGPYWAVLHHRQAAEADHDPVYRVVIRDGELRLGEEIPESTEAPNHIRKIVAEVHLSPKARRVDVSAHLDLSGTAGGRASVLRLGDDYAVARMDADGRTRRLVDAGSGVPAPQEGDVVRAGSLLIVWTARPAHSIDLVYGATLPERPANGEDDRIGDRSACLTSWWLPGAERKPFVTQVAITGPADWTLRSEGVLVEPSQPAAFPPDAQERRLAFRCDVPIAYPKVVAGRYELGSSRQDGGRLFQAFGFPPLDRPRLERATRNAASAVRFYEGLLGPFPFPGYDLYDGDGYYGIESYSHAVLDPRITDSALSHEIGHTYFGGLVPCAYVRDSWNEGVTQYVDSVLLHGDEDRTLEQALGVLDVRRSLAEMPVPWADDNASYTRGAYVLTMLAHEIGQEAVDRGLRAVVEGRKGLDTVWSDLRAPFEKAAGRPLDWFWNQWISGRVFPRLDLAACDTRADAKAFLTRIRVAQSGTERPYRLRFLLRLASGGDGRAQEVTLADRESTFEISTSFRPAQASLRVLGYAYVKADRAAKAVN